MASNTTLTRPTCAAENARTPSMARHAGGFAFAGITLMALAAGGTLLVGELRTQYAADTAYQVNYTAETSSETTHMEMLRDGEPMERGGRRAGGPRTQQVEWTYTDTLAEVGDGLPTKLERVFDSVGGSSVSQGRDGEVERDLESEFEGLTLELTQGEDGVEVDIKDGESPDAERLEGLVLALPLDGLLPEEEVAVGGEWEISGDAFLTALGLPLQTRLIDRREAPSRGGERGGRGGRGGGFRRASMRGGDVLASADWTITATLSDETREVGGVECALVLIQAEIEGQIEAPEGMDVETSIEGELEAELVFNPETSRPVSFEVEGGYEVSTETSMSSERGSFEMSRTEETEIAVSVAIESIERDD